MIFKRGSINGVKYLFSDSTTKFGRKTVVHEFIRSDTRYVEDMGKMGRIFSINVKITGKSDSEYNRNKERFEKQLDSEGAKTLIHPTEGRKQNVVFTVCSKSETIASTRVAIYNLECSVSDANIYPSKKDGNKSFINKLFDDCYKSLESNFPDAFENVKNFVETYNTVRENIQDLTSNINEITSFVNGTADEMSAFVSDLLEFQDSISSLIQTPTQLASRLSIIYNNLSLITQQPQDLLRTTLDLIGVGKGRDTITGTSKQIQITNEANKELYFFNDVALMCVAYQASTVISYRNEEELKDVVAKLDTYFENIDPDYNDETYYILQSLRSQTLKYLYTLSPQLPKIIYIEINQQPVSILAYRLYGNSERMQEIIDLNNIENPSYISGRIKVLSK